MKKIILSSVLFLTQLATAQTMVWGILLILRLIFRDGLSMI